MSFACARVEERIETDDTLHEQLDEQAVSFETRHPTIAKAIREVMDVLHKMGI